MSFDFDRPIDRTGTASVKWDGRKAMFGADHADVLPLWVADMDFAAPEAVTRALSARAAHPIYGYTLFPDSLFTALAGWMQRRHGWTIEREEVIWSPGVVPSLHAAVLGLTRPGEGVIVQSPVYPPFFSAVHATGRQLIENPLRLEGDGYAMDLEYLEHCAKAARLLILCSPHNPVGRVWKPDELQAVLAIARRHGLTVLSDEIHHDLVYPGETHTVLARLAGPGDRVITAAAPSKSFNIPGLGLSALICPDPEDRAALVRAFDQLHVSASNPFSIAAFEAAYREGAPWLDALLGYLAGTRAFALDLIARECPGIRAIPPQGTYLLWLDCRELGLDDQALKRFFLEKPRLGLNPGISFGAPGSGFMRLNLGAPHATIAEALQRLALALRPQPLAETSLGCKQ
ncbi:MAG: aminotransferase [Gammaproteobacteria bacterium RIFOXYA12_FULL_61_12]|nr:MAG: aminotransferase [Gammaproteobacteria bacterium RIFOXYD12_FULL_61_37]OGT93946.1 MAG: aminotransferase [Gammaproteobacteria bacterium RIFOXYA12_FULL_61_12]